MPVILLALTVALTRVIKKNFSSLTQRKRERVGHYNQRGLSMKKGTGEKRRDRKFSSVAVLDSQQAESTPNCNA